MENVLKIGKHSFNYILCQVAINTINFFLIPIYTHHLSTADYGIINTFGITINFFLPIFSLALPSALGRYYFEYRSSEYRLKSYLGTILISLNLWSLFLFLFLTLFLRHTLEHILKIEFYHYIFPALMVSFINSTIGIYLALLQVKEKSGLYTIVNIIQYFLISILTIFLILGFKMGALGVVIARTIGSFIIIIGIFILISRMINFVFNANDIKTSLLYSLPLVPHLLSHTLMGTIDRVFLNNIKSLSQTGVYSLGYNIASLLSIFISAINLAWSPFLYNQLKERSDRAKEDIARLISYIVCCIGLGALIVGLMGKEIIMIMAKSSYWESAPIVPVLTLAFVFQGFYFLSINQLFYYKKTILIPIITFITCVVNVILNYILIPHWGIFGASWATVITYFIMWVLVFISAQRVYKLKYNIRVIYPILLALLFWSGNYIFVEGSNISIVSVFLIKIIETIFYGVFVYLTFFTRLEKHDIKLFFQQYVLQFILKYFTQK